MNLIFLKSNRGTTIILLSLMLSAILGFGAIVIDIGRVMVEKQKMQNALDATSLAAALDLPDVSKATSTANKYIILNGYSPSDINISFSDFNNKIKISGSKEISYTLARIMGLESTTITPNSQAQLASIGDAFNYAIFSGSDSTILSINGSNQYIGGNTHTNFKFLANGSKITITGDCEAVTTIKVNGSKINISDISENSPYVPMPDFSETIKIQAETIGQVFHGDKTFNGSNMFIDEPIFVDGNVTVNGSRFVGKGCVLATGTITFNGSNLNQSTDDAVCFYSKSGNITVNGSNANFDGILYAPNGKITLNGSSQTINGRIIANTVSINGSNLTIQSGINELYSLPSKGVKLVS